MSQLVVADVAVEVEEQLRKCHCQDGPQPLADLVVAYFDAVGELHGEAMDRLRDMVGGDEHEMCFFLGRSGMAEAMMKWAEIHSQRGEHTKACSLYRRVRDCFGIDCLPEGVSSGPRSH